MDIRNLLSLYTLLNRLCDGVPNPAVVPYVPQKTASFALARALNPFPRHAPEQHGYSSRHLTTYLRALEQSEDSHVHSVMVLADGKIILSASAPGYSIHTPHIMYSMTKSVTALALGILFDDGKLSPDEKLSDLFPEHADEIRSGRRRDVTVRDLLTMSVPAGFAEIGTILESDWIRSYFESSVRYENDRTFYYNSITSHVLAAIAERKAGMPLDDFLKTRLFNPMGIRVYQYERNAKGIAKGGFGLYLAPVDMAKIGMLILNRGIYRRRRLISENWISAMIEPQNKKSRQRGSYAYGFQIWCDPEYGNVLCSGMFGQNILIVPQTRTVIVLTAGNQEVFQDSEMLKITRVMLADGNRRERNMPRDRAGEQMLSKAEAHFGETRLFAKPVSMQRSVARTLHVKRVRKPRGGHRLRKKIGISLIPERNNCGILPLFVSVMQNNYEGGITEIRIEPPRPRFLLHPTVVLTVCERLTEYRFSIDLSREMKTEVDIRGERYLVSLFSEYDVATETLRLLFRFPELASEKTWSLTFGETPRLVIRETPGYAVAEPFITRWIEDARGVTGFLTRWPADMLSERLKKAFAPSLALRYADAISDEDLSDEEAEENGVPDEYDQYEEEPVDDEIIPELPKLSDGEMAELAGDSSVMNPL